MALAMLAPLAQAQDAPTYTVYALLKESSSKPFAADFVREANADKATLAALGDPLSIAPAWPLPPLPDSPAVDRKNLKSPDAVMRRWVALKFNATASKQLANLDRLSSSALFEAVDVDNAYKFSYAINDPLYHFDLTNPNRYQWGVDALALPAAFDWTRGRVLIGALDSGLPGMFRDDGLPQTDTAVHPDIEPNIRRHLSYGVVGQSPNTGHLCPEAFDIGFSWGTINDNGVIKPFDYLSARSDGSSTVGHGTHVTGIMVGRVNNQSGGSYVGVTGTCPECSFLMMRSSLDTGAYGCMNEALAFAMANGASAMNFSFGENATGSIIAEARLTAAADRDVVMAAASGNDRRGSLDHPASSTKVIAVGAIDYQRRLWDEGLGLAHPGTLEPVGTRCPSGERAECGSNYGPGLDVVAPGAQVLSTITQDYAPQGTPSNPASYAPCTSTTDPTGTNRYGVCTGTSMASPYIAGIAGLVRSINPLLSHEQAKAAIEAGATRTAGYTANQMGAGVPDAQVSVKKALGIVKGANVVNRLTPLFSLAACTSGCSGLPPLIGTASWLFTTSPQTAAAALLGELYYTNDRSTPPVPATHLMGTSVAVPYVASKSVNANIGPAVAGYTFRPSSLVPAQNPGASAFIFSGARNPATGNEVDASPSYSALVPLLRLSAKCDKFRKHVYTVDESADGRGNPAGAGTRQFFESRGSANCATSLTTTGYYFDGVEGYIHRAYAPNGALLTQPEGTKRLYRYYNASVNAWALVLEDETSNPAFSGYSAQAEATYGRTLLGYVYPNIDTDGDGLVDGFERTVGTNPGSRDSDCDGRADNVEFPLAALSVSDPVDNRGRCAVSVILDDDEP